MIEELESLTRDAWEHGAKVEVIVMARDVYERMLTETAPIRIFKTDDREDSVTLESGAYKLAMRKYLPHGRLMTATQQWLDDYDECVRQFEEARRD